MRVLHVDATRIVHDEENRHLKSPFSAPSCSSSPRPQIRLKPTRLFHCRVAERSGDPYAGTRIHSSISPSLSRGKMSVVLAWLNARVVHPVLQVIQRGAEPKQLAFSAALGVTLGIFPICGTTVILCGLAIAVLRGRCNAVTVMVLNFAVTPLELSLIIPFLRLGEVITGSQHFPLTSDAFKKVITGHASEEVLLSIVRAMLGWLIAAPLVLAVLYTISVPCFKFLVNKFGIIPSSPRSPIKVVLLCPNESESTCCSETGLGQLLINGD